MILSARRAKRALQDRYNEQLREQEEEDIREQDTLLCQSCARDTHAAQPHIAASGTYGGDETQATPTAST